MKCVPPSFRAPMRQCTRRRAEGRTSVEALYLHVPFCKSRCAYCDFATDACEDGAAMNAYVEALCLQVRRAARAGLLGQVKTVYVGGGTPTHLGSARLGQLASTLSFSLHMDAVEEFTVECNPESLAPAMVRDLFAAGVTRFSIGAQSFSDAELSAIGRAHTAVDTRAAVAAVRERTGNFSLDLMCGLPGQTPRSWEESLRAALDLEPAHVSVYPLSVEEGTPLVARVASGEAPVAGEDGQADMMLRAEELLGAAGFTRYEVASYAQPGFESRHNTAYWTGVEYLGLGAGAASMLSPANFAACVNAGIFTVPGEGERVCARAADGDGGAGANAADGAAGPDADAAGEGGGADVRKADGGESARVRVATAFDSAAFSAGGGLAQAQVERFDARQALLEDVMLSLRRSAGLGEELRVCALEAVPELDSVLGRLVSFGLLEERADGCGRPRLVPTRRGWLCGNEVFGAVWGLAES